MSMEVRIWGAIVLASIGFGTTGVATRAALNAGVPPMALAAIRALFAMSVLYGWFIIMKKPVNRDRHNLTTGLVAGLFQLSLPFILFSLAYQYASAGFVGIIVALMPLIVALMAHFALPDEPLTRAKVIGLAVAFSGVALLLLSGDSGLGSGGQPLVAALLTLGAVVSMSIATIFTRGRAGTFEPLQLTLMQFTVGTIVVGAVMILFEGFPSGLSAWAWTLLVYLTAVGGLMPTFMFFWLLGNVSSTRAVLVGYITPLVSLVFGVLLLDEIIQLGIVIGGLTILIGVLLTDREERRIAAG